MASAKYKIESGIQLLARLTKKSAIEEFYPILFSSGPKHGDIVEFFGNNHSQSLLLIDMICEALMPKQLNETRRGVLIFKTDGKLDFEEMVNILRLKVISQMANNNNIDNLLHSILNSLFILDIYDANQFYTTIHGLDNILLQHPNISLVIFDTLTAFYWSEQGFKISKMDLYVKKILKLIQNMTKEYKVICVYTRPEYFSSNKDLDNLGKNELSDIDSLNYRMQVVDKDSIACYQVNVRTRDKYFEKYFNVINNEIKWQ